jgi:hypothetical protein
MILAALDRLGETSIRLKRQRDKLRRALAMLIDRDLSYINGEARGITHTEIIEARGVLSAVDEEINS